MLGQYNVHNKLINVVPNCLCLPTLEVKMRNVSITISESNELKHIGQYSMYLSFLYDQTMLKYVQDIRGCYNADYKDWELPLSIYSNVTNKLKELDIPFNVLGDPNIGTNNVTSYCKTKPYSHQLEFLTYALSHKSFLLGDQMGVGKSREIIDLALHLKRDEGMQHCLIICGINGTKYNWLEEINIHSNESAIILGTHVGKNGNLIEDGTEAKLKQLMEVPKEFFWIINVEALRLKHGGRFAIADVINSLCYNKTIGLIAFDEAHICRTPESMQARALLQIKCDRIVPMSGTFLINKPLDLYVPLKWIGKEQHNYWAYKNHYCIFGAFGTHEVIGYKNLKDLHNTVKNCMLRRLTSQVLDLPPKIQKREYVELNKEQAKLYSDIKKQILEDIDKIKMSVDPLSELLRLRQVTGTPELLSTKVTKSAKIDRLLELVEEVTNEGNKCIVYSNWTSVTDILKEKLSKYNPAYITGEVTANKRMEQVKKFQDDPTCKVIIGTIGAMGTGITLTAANTIVFMDEPWNRAIKDQAEQRAYRVGTKNTVEVITLVAKKTIDEAIYNIVQRKGKMSDALIDGKVSVDSKGKLVNYLLQ